MFCRNCGNPIPEGGVCPVCNPVETVPMEAPVIEPVVEASPVAQTDYIEDPVALEQPATNPGKTLGMVSLILGIFSLAMGTVCCSCLGGGGVLPLGAGVVGGILPLVAGIVGIILGVMGKNKSKIAGFKNTMATVGIILSVVAIVVILSAILVNVIMTGLLVMTNMNSGYYYY